MNEQVKVGLAKYNDLLDYFEENPSTETNKNAEQIRVANVKIGNQLDALKEQLRELEEQK